MLGTEDYKDELKNSDCLYGIYSLKIIDTELEGTSKAIWSNLLIGGN